MFSINPRRWLVTTAVMAGLLAAVGPASAATGTAAYGPSSSVQAKNVKAVVVLIGANDYG